MFCLEKFMSMMEDRRRLTFLIKYDYSSSAKIKIIRSSKIDREFVSGLISIKLVWFFK